MIGTIKAVQIFVLLLMVMMSGEDIWRSGGEWSLVSLRPFSFMLCVLSFSLLLFVQWCAMKICACVLVRVTCGDLFFLENSSKN